MKICANLACGAHLKKSVGHIFCRKHSACRRFSSQSQYWDPEGCDVCEHLLTKSKSADPSVASLALAKLRVWAKGWAKDFTETRFLASRELRDILFPSAPDSSFLGEDSDMPPGNVPQEDEEISPSQEEALLRDPLKQGAHLRSEVSPMEEENEDTASESSVSLLHSRSLTSPLGDDTASAEESLSLSPQDFIKEVKGLLQGMQSQITELKSQKRGGSLPFSNPGTTPSNPGLPTSPSGPSPASVGSSRTRTSLPLGSHQGCHDLPADPNPWRSCAIFCLVENGTKLLTPHGALLVSDLEFALST